MNDYKAKERAKVRKSVILDRFERTLSDRLKLLVSKTIKPAQEIVPEVARMESNTHKGEVNSKVAVTEYRGTPSMEHSLTFSLLLNDTAGIESASYIIKNGMKEKYNVAVCLNGIKTPRIHIEYKDNSQIMSKVNIDHTRDASQQQRIYRSRQHFNFDKEKLNPIPIKEKDTVKTPKKTSVSGVSDKSTQSKNKHTHQAKIVKKDLSPVQTFSKVTTLQLKHDSYVSSTPHADSNDRTILFSNLKINSSIQDNAPIIDTKTNSKHNKKSKDEFKDKYKLLLKEHHDLNNKFCSLEAKHQKLFELFKDLEVKYRDQSDTFRDNVLMFSKRRSSINQVQSLVTTSYRDSNDSANEAEIS